MNFEYGKAILEALLFASPEPLSVHRLAELIGVEERATQTLLGELRQEYDQSGRGLTIIEAAGGYQLATRPEFQEFVARLLPDRHKTGLSRAALETLAVVAYHQPATRAEVERVRGVASDRSVITLLEKAMVREAGRKDAPGRPILYETTPLFLQHFGLNSLADLPRLEDFPVSLEALENALAAEAGLIASKLQEAQDESGQGSEEEKEA